MQQRERGAMRRTATATGALIWAELRCCHKGIRIFAARHLHVQARSLLGWDFARDQRSLQRTDTDFLLTSPVARQLGHSHSWDTLTTGTLVRLGHSHDWDTRTTGTLVRLGHSYDWDTRTTGTLGRLGHADDWDTRTMGTRGRRGHSHNGDNC